MKECGKDDDIVLIHDGMPPLITEQLIAENIEAVKRYRSAITAEPSIESVVQSIDGENIRDVLPRSHGGEQVIRPECLTEQDPVKIALPYGTEGAAVPVQKLRDIQKLYAAMTDGKAEYVLCGVEGAVKTGAYSSYFFTAPLEDIIFCWSRGRPGQMRWPPIKNKYNLNKLINKKDTILPYIVFIRNTTYFDL